MDSSTNKAPLSTGLTPAAATDALAEQPYEADPSGSPAPGQLSAEDHPIAGADDATGPQLLVFVLGQRLFGCLLSDVREIIPHRATTRLPGAPEQVIGLLNLRGTLLTVLDLGVALGASSGLALGGQVLVIEAEGRIVGCRVDAVRRVYPLPELLPPSHVGNGMPPGIVIGIGDAGDNMVAVLDLPVLVRQTLLFPGER